MRLDRGHLRSEHLDPPAACAVNVAHISLFNAIGQRGLLGNASLPGGLALQGVDLRVISASTTAKPILTARTIALLKVPR